jgi:hypothetical protein
MKYFLLGVLCTLAVVNPEVTKAVLARAVDMTNGVYHTAVNNVELKKE